MRKVLNPVFIIAVIAGFIITEIYFKAVNSGPGQTGFDIGA